MRRGGGDKESLLLYYSYNYGATCHYYSHQKNTKRRYEKMFEQLTNFDIEVGNLVLKEDQRQRTTLGMIPSESFTVLPVRQALSSAFVHKYAEGQVGNRFYEGNEFADVLESLCKSRISNVFKLPNTWSVNVQAHSGCNANLAVYNALINPGDKILSMFLPDGGHLSHGWSFPTSDEGNLSAVNEDIYLGGSRKVSIVSKYYEVIQYKVERTSKMFDYNKIMEIAKKYRPKIIISGGTAYPRDINYKEMKSIANAVGAFYLADISHEAGLIAAGAMPSPVGIADVVTFTTHKTLCGPRAAVILSNNEISKKVDSSVFPGIQGGPHLHSIAAICVCMKYAQTDKFNEYAFQTIKNAKQLAQSLSEMGYDVVTGGTDKHLVLVDLRSKSVSARLVARTLDFAGIVINKNTVPFEQGSSVNPSGIRMGTPILTIRGMKESEMKIVAQLIDRVVRECSFDLSNTNDLNILKDSAEIKKIKTEVSNICTRFPLPE